MGFFDVIPLLKQSCSSINNFNVGLLEVIRKPDQQDSVYLVWDQEQRYRIRTTLVKMFKLCKTSTHILWGPTGLRPVGPVYIHLTGRRAGGSESAGQRDSVSFKCLEFCRSIHKDGGHWRQSCGWKDEENVKWQGRRFNDYLVFFIFLCPDRASYVSYPVYHYYNIHLFYLKHWFKTEGSYCLWGQLTDEQLWPGPSFLQDK